MRSSLIALVRKDLKGYFDQPTGYILIVVLVALVSYWFFRSALLTGEASLRPLFTVDFTAERPSLPWLLALFVPAATMRLIAEEHRDGTLEMLVTQPIRAWVVLLAKFLSGFLFVSTAILATLGIPIALAFAGDLDDGAVFAQYLGVLFLAAAFVSIGLFTSSLTRNQVVAFILALTFNAILMFIGLEVVAIALPVKLAGLLQTLSPVTHFSTIARGIIDLRDIIYFVSLLFTFLSATFLVIRSKSLSHESVQYRNLQLGVGGLIVISLLVGWFGNAIGGRLDLTEDKLFTLSPATTQVLSGLDDILTIKLYESKDPPPQIALVTRDVKDFLKDFAARSDGNVKFITKSPDDDEDTRREATLAGVNPREFAEVGQTEISSRMGYLGLTMTYADRREIIEFIPSVDGFEYALARLANKMIKRESKTVGFLVGHGEKNTENDLMILSEMLEEQYNVVQVQASDDGSLDLSGVDALIIPGPTERIPDPSRDELTRYIDEGGKAMILVDTIQVDLQQFVAIPNRNSFADFVDRFGIIVEEDLAFDTRSHVMVGLGRGYPYWMRVPTVDPKVTGSVGRVFMPWASPLGITETAEVGPVEIITLLETTPYGAIHFNPVDVSPVSERLATVREEELVTSLIGVAIVETSSDRDEIDGGSFRLVVVGDSEWITDGAVSQAPEENLALALNLVDWLVQEDILASIRSKVVSPRQLDFTSSTHQNVVQYINIVGVPLAFVGIGFLVYVRRRAISLMEYRREE